MRKRFSSLAELLQKDGSITLAIAESVDKLYKNLISNDDFRKEAAKFKGKGGSGVKK